MVGSEMIYFANERADPQFIRDLFFGVYYLLAARPLVTLATATYSYFFHSLFLSDTLFAFLFSVCLFFFLSHFILGWVNS